MIQTYKKRSTCIEKKKLPIFLLIYKKYTYMTKIKNNIEKIDKN